MTQNLPPFAALITVFCVISSTAMATMVCEYKGVHNEGTINEGRYVSSFIVAGESGIHHWKDDAGLLDFTWTLKCQAGDEDATSCWHFGDEGGVFIYRLTENNMLIRASGNTASDIARIELDGPYNCSKR